MVSEPVTLGGGIITTNGSPEPEGSKTPWVSQTSTSGTRRGTDRRLAGAPRGFPGRMRRFLRGVGVPGSGGPGSG